MDLIAHMIAPLNLQYDRCVTTSNSVYHLSTKETQDMDVYIEEALKHW